jgi:hypothetical protein
LDQTCPELLGGVTTVGPVGSDDDPPEPEHAVRDVADATAATRSRNWRKRGGSSLNFRQTG